MEFLKNIALNLKATGPAAVLIVWIICVTLLGLFGSGEMASKSFGLLAFFGGAVFFALASKLR